jgi:hypothetical protein
LLATSLFGVNVIFPNCLDNNTRMSFQSYICAQMITLNCTLVTTAYFLVNTLPYYSDEISPTISRHIAAHFKNYFEVCLIVFILYFVELNVLAIVSGSMLGLLVLVLSIVLFGYR